MNILTHKTDQSCNGAIHNSKVRKNGDSGIIAVLTIGVFVGLASAMSAALFVQSLVIAGIAYCVSGIFVVLVLSVVMYVRQKDEFAREYLLE